MTRQNSVQWSYSPGNQNSTSAFPHAAIALSKDLNAGCAMKTAQKQHKTAVPIVKLGFYHQQFMFVVTVRICSEKYEFVTWDYCSQLFLESHKFHGSSHHQAVHLVSSKPYLVQTPTASSEKGSPYQVGQQLKTKKAQYPHGCLELPIFRVKSQLSSPCLQFLTWNPNIWRVRVRQLAESLIFSA